MIKHLAYLLLFAAIIAIGSGCELGAASSTQKVVITPDVVTLTINEEQTFTASGGYEYTWSLENPEYGVLSTTRGDTTVYTSYYDPDDQESDTAAQTLRVVSNIAGTDHSGGVGSNTNEAYQQTAEAYIVHMSTNHPSLNP